MTAPKRSTASGNVSRVEFDAFERNQGKRLDGIESTLRAITNRLEDVGRADWRTLSGFGGLLLGLVGGIGALTLTPIRDTLSRLEAKQEQQDEKLSSAAANRWTEKDQRTYEQGVLMETRRLEALVGKAIEKLDDQLQREMRLLDDALQREMRMLLDAPMERLKAAEDDLESIEAALAKRQQWMAEQDLGSTSMRAGHEERIRHIEALLEEISAEQRRRTLKVYDQ